MRRRQAAALLAAMPFVPALGQPIDLSSGGPVDITARDGIEWRRDENIVIARGNARAVRDGVTVDADRLIARYRPKAGATQAQTQSQDPGAAGGSSEIYRVEAEGHVVIFTETDRATGDRAVYDIDQAVMVMTGNDLTLTTQDQFLTARDSLEYWSARRMAVARGEAVATDAESRTIRADVLVGYFHPAEQQPQPARGAAPRNGGAQDDSRAGKIERVDAFGNVEVRTPQEVLRGDRGYYSPEQEIARVAGNVRITRGENQINGALAEANLRTGVSRMLSAPGARVQGLIVQEEGKEGEVPAPGPQPTGVPQRRRR